MSEAKFAVTLAGVRGACAGVERAISAVETALQQHGPPVYVRKQIVHNASVVETLAGKGAVFVEAVAEVPDGGLVLISAHGAPPAEFEAAADRGLRVVDATCPLVTKVHKEIDGHQRRGRPVIIVGHRDHDEVIGHLGHSPSAHVVASVEDVESLPDLGDVGYVTQTTLSVDDTRTVTDSIETRYAAAKGPKGSDICYATQNRQSGVKGLVAHGCDLIVVVSDRTSSNGTRLVDIGRASGCRTVMVAGPANVDAALLADATHVGVTGAASTPMSLIDSVVRTLVSLGGASPETLPAEPETVVFGVPELAGAE